MVRNKYPRLKIKSIIILCCCLLHAALSLGQNSSGMPSGDIGIGTDTPRVKLHLKGSEGVLLTLQGTSFAAFYMHASSASKKAGIHFISDGFNTNSLRFGRYGLSGDRYGSQWEANPIVFDMDAPDGSLIVADNGNVGMGVYFPDEKLTVNGNIRSKKVKVTQTGWADYVFHPDYRLRPLSDVERYIQQNNHLPEVPSAADVEKDGIDLGDTQATLLKKIEELTLYLIAQNKKLELLEKELQQLKKSK